jgi:hypothetical protein
MKRMLFRIKECIIYSILGEEIYKLRLKSYVLEAYRLELLGLKEDDRTVKIRNRIVYMQEFANIID